MKLFHSTLLAALVAAAAHAATPATPAPEDQDDSPRAAATADFDAAEKDLAAVAEAAAAETAVAAGEEAVIETSRPYLLPRLFTIPTAYSLQSYEIRFGGQGNIHATFADMNTESVKASAAIGLGGIMEIGYQLDEYYTVENISDKILMGYFKLTLLKESKYLPALSISAAKNLRTGFHATNSYDYKMDEDLYEVVMSKAFRIGDHMVSIHPGAQIIRDEVTSVAQLGKLAQPYEATKINPRLGLSWQNRPKTLFMYELKMLHPTQVTSFADGAIGTHRAVENNLGVRYYLRNWLCIDSGIRHYLDLDTREDDMKLHANFVGVIPTAQLYERVRNYFAK